MFHVPLRGSLALLLVEGLLFILVSLSLGILISARTTSQRVAMLGALVGTMLPTMLLSGFIFPLESMPWPLRAISVMVPARWFVLVARSIMLKGVGLDYLWPRDPCAADNGAACCWRRAPAPSTIGWTSRMRRILFWHAAEVLHVVRDRATLAQVMVDAAAPAARSCRTRRLSASPTRPPTSSTSIARACRAVWSTRFSRVRALPGRGAVGVARSGE